MPFRFTYDKPFLYDLADLSATGTFDCNSVGYTYGAICFGVGSYAGADCNSYGVGAGGACNPGYIEHNSMCYDGNSNNPQCSTGAHATTTCSSGTST